MPTRALLAALLTAAVVLVGCQAGSSASEGPTSPTPVPSMTASDLGDLIPDEVAGFGMLVFSMTGEQFLEGGSDATFSGLLDSLGVAIEDITVATAIGGTDDGTKTATVIAFRAAGVDADTMITAFEAVSGTNESSLDWHADTIGGKSVQASSTNADFPEPVVLYGTGDILFFVTSSDRSITEEIIRKLP